MSFERLGERMLTEAKLFRSKIVLPFLPLFRYVHLEHGHSQMYKTVICNYLAYA